MAIIQIHVICFIWYKLPFNLGKGNDLNMYIQLSKILFCIGFDHNHEFAFKSCRTHFHMFKMKSVYCLIFEVAECHPKLCFLFSFPLKALYKMYYMKFRWAVLFRIFFLKIAGHLLCLLQVFFFSTNSFVWHICHTTFFFFLAFCQ